MQNAKGARVAESRFSSASVGSFDDESIDAASFSLEFVTAATDVGMFESECPCCGTVISFRLMCSAIADDTENPDE